MDCAFDGSASSCLLDTGAGDKILVDSDSIFGGYTAVDSGSNENDLGVHGLVDIIRVDRLRIGGTDFGPINIKRTKEASGAPRSPLIGPQAVVHGSFALRFEGSMELILDAPAPAEPFYPLSAFDKDRHLFIKAAIGDDSMTTLFDTGAGITQIDRDYVAAHPGDFSLVGTMSFPGRADVDIYELRSLSLGGRRFDNVAMLATDFSFFRKKSNHDDLRLMLGYNVITQADWYFDLARQRWSVSNRR